jgi:hypothetical protein
VGLAAERAFGQPALWPPFLLARVVSDGPGTWYLRERCGAGAGYALCAHLDALPTRSAGEFLWETAPGRGVLSRASNAEVRRIVAEQAEVVLSAVAAYPLEQLAASARNFGRQLAAFGVGEFAQTPAFGEKLAALLPAEAEAYARTRVARSAAAGEDGSGWALAALGAVHAAALVLSSLAAAAALLLLPPRRGSGEGRPGRGAEAALVLAVAAGIVANAAVTGIISEPHDRFGARVVWALPMVCALLVLRRLPRPSLGGGGGAAG